MAYQKSVTTHIRDHFDFKYTFNLLILGHNKKSSKVFFSNIDLTLVRKVEQIKQVFGVSISQIYYWIEILIEHQDLFKHQTAGGNNKHMSLNLLIFTS